MAKVEPRRSKWPQNGSCQKGPIREALQSEGIPVCQILNLQQGLALCYLCTWLQLQAGTTPQLGCRTARNTRKVTTNWEHPLTTHLSIQSWQRPNPWVADVLYSWPGYRCSRSAGKLDSWQSGLLRQVGRGPSRSSPGF